MNTIAALKETLREEEEVSPTRASPAGAALPASPAQTPPPPQEPIHASFAASLEAMQHQIQQLVSELSELKSEQRAQRTAGTFTPTGQQQQQSIQFGDLQPTFQFSPQPPPLPQHLPKCDGQFSLARVIGFCDTWSPVLQNLGERLFREAASSKQHADAMKSTSELRLDTPAFPTNEPSDVFTVYNFLKNADQVTMPFGSDITKIQFVISKSKAIQNHFGTMNFKPFHVLYHDYGLFKQYVLSVSTHLDRFELVKETALNVKYSTSVTAMLLQLETCQSINSDAQPEHQIPFSEVKRLVFSNSNNGIPELLRMYMLSYKIQIRDASGNATGPSIDLMEVSNMQQAKAAARELDDYNYKANKGKSSSYGHSRQHLHAIPVADDSYDSTQSCDSDDSSGTDSEQSDDTSGEEDYSANQLYAAYDNMARNNAMHDNRLHDNMARNNAMHD
eukprot:CAMPEP_0183819650 /NCGR_PEP_ID=MMETSP0803_2-20130417/64246_1 /TAXON_ID=195967 /ORGANISM="Crustomastix stigmata, Strain CCMP3273" /LENGTH=446 /DNA_ID=CAMNT_0026064539 /DNA_START=824 /DNA_END=2161 /DNA_ORIENTATION=+